MRATRGGSCLSYLPDGRPVLPESFWQKVQKTDGCWLWIASIDLKGYGQFREGCGLTQHLAHRLSYAAHFGAIPSGGHVLHSCDRPACVNPGHLRLGTHAENMREMAEKRRACQGVAHPRARLNEEAVKVIRFLKTKGANTKRLASAYGVTHGCIIAIAAGLTWKHVEVVNR